MSESTSGQSGVPAKRTRVVILGAAGRDFHNFNVVYREDPTTEVVAFTATQIPRIEGRKYPAELAGPLYPEGIPILPESEMERIIVDEKVDLAIHAYSDISHQDLMHAASRAMAAGADFGILGPNSTMVKADVPVISVCAVRTGCGKSQTSRKVASLLRKRGIPTAVIRHPMPYGDLAKQRVQRFSKPEDLVTHDCTIEEREEYEPYLELGMSIYAGVDYGAIMEQAQQEAKALIWDGGNNDLPFYRSDLEIVVADPHRAGHGMAYHPGEVNLRRAQVVVINKIDSAPAEQVGKVRRLVSSINPDAEIVAGRSEVGVDKPELLLGKKVLVIEDGPTLTHGEMAFGAGWVAAKKFGATSFADPRPYLQGSLKEVFAKFDHLGAILPAMGYWPEQLADLSATIEATPCDAVVVATPINLCRVIEISKPTARVSYWLEEEGEPNLTTVLDRFVEEHGL